MGPAGWGLPQVSPLVLPPLFLFLYLPWPWPVSTPSPFLTSVSPLPIALIFCLLEGAPRRETKPRAQAQASWLLGLAVIFTLLPALLPLSGQAVLPFALELPTPQGAAGLASSPSFCSPRSSPRGWPVSRAVGRPQSQDTCPGPRQSPHPGRRATLGRTNFVP